MPREEGMQGGRHLGRAVSWQVGAAASTLRCDAGHRVLLGKQGGTGV